jgi:hypothetical protein
MIVGSRESRGTPASNPNMTIRNQALRATYGCVSVFEITSW